MRNGQLRMRVTSHTEDDNVSITIELAGNGFARIVAPTSSQMICVARVGSIIKRGKVDLAIRTTMGASSGIEKGELGEISDISGKLTQAGTADGEYA